MGFLALLLMPLAFSWRGARDIETLEKRPAASLPESPFRSGEAFQGYPAQLEAFFNDRFGFRGAAIRFTRRWQYELHWSNPQGSDVLRGRNGWLFLNTKTADNPVDIFTGKSTFTPTEIARATNRLSAWHQWLDARGITFVVMIAPNKISVYPDQVPHHLQPAPDPTRTDRLLAALAAAGVPVVDPTPELLALADSDSTPLYHRLDTHWNHRGAFAAYEPLADFFGRKFPQSRAILPDQLDFRPIKKTDGDLARLLGLGDDLTDESFAVGSRDVVWAHSTDVQPFSVVNPTHFEKPSPELPRAVIYHDSFMIHLHGFLLTHFRESELHWRSQLDATAITTFDPDIVILQIVERSLHHLVTLPPPPAP